MNCLIREREIEGMLLCSFAFSSSLNAPEGSTHGSY